MKKIMMIATLLLASGCVSQTSPERHSRYFAVHDPEMVGGNFASNPTYTAKANLPLFQKVYQQGQADKAKGLTAAQAQQVADSIYTSASKSQVRSTFTGNKSDTHLHDGDNESLALWGTQLKETYLDGYNGIH
ncbi:hypothetical protein EGM70_16030 [Enterobacteriaceae bacterium 89]|nr:hypothetical protein [Enterobacteriaceae bacterium 89]